MRTRLMVGSVLLILGCPLPAEDGGEEAAETDETDDTTGETGETDDTTEETGETGDTTEETGETTDGGGECLPPQQGVPRTFTVDLLGFPEVANDLLTTPDGLDYSGPCVVDTLDFDGQTLTMVLSCEHPAPSDPEGASVTITTAATGLPAGVDLGDTVTFQAYVIESQGGLVVDPEFSLFVLDANVESYQVRDDEGPIFAGDPHDISGNFQEVAIMGTHDCPTWEGCSDSGTISGYINASAGGQSIDVQIGEVGLLDIGTMSWDVSLFQAAFDSNDCHFGVGGSFSVVRRP